MLQPEFCIIHGPGLNSSPLSPSLCARLAESLVLEKVYTGLQAHTCECMPKRQAALRPKQCLCHRRTLRPVQVSDILRFAFSALEMGIKFLCISLGLSLGKIKKNMHHFRLTSALNEGWLFWLLLKHETYVLWWEKGELAVRTNVLMLHTSTFCLKNLGGDGYVYYVDCGVVDIYQNVSNYILSKYMWFVALQLYLNKAAKNQT